MVALLLELRGVLQQQRDAGRNTFAVSPRRRARTSRPTACAKNNGVAVEVAYTPTIRRGTSTPSLTIRTATSQRASLAPNSLILRPARGSSESTTTGVLPLMSASSRAYARALVLSVAMTSPPASGTCLRTSVRRRSAARSTCGIQSPCGSSAVRQACAVTSFACSAPSVALTSSPALVRQRIWPEYARNMTGRTTPSARASAYP